jgi:hypothetical protein
MRQFIRLIAFFAFVLVLSSQAAGEETFVWWGRNHVIFPNGTTKWNADKPIPYEMYRYLSENQHCTVTVESTLKITHDLEESHIYTQKDNRVAFQIRLLEVPEIQQLQLGLYSYDDRILNLQTDCINVHFSSNGITYTDQLVILNCQYGLYIGQSKSQIINWIEDRQETQRLCTFLLACIAVPAVIVTAYLLIRRKRRKAVL